MAKEKQVVIDSMDVSLAKAMVKREGKRDDPKMAMAYLTFATVLTVKQLNDYGLSDIATDPRFKMGEEIILSQMKQGLQGTIDLTVYFIGPLSGQVKAIIESGGMLTKMSLMGEVFSIEVSYLLQDDEDWIMFGKIFTDYIGLDMKITAKPDNRGRQEQFKPEQIDRITTDGRGVIEEPGDFSQAEKEALKLGDSLEEGDSVEFITSKTGKKVTVKGKKKKRGDEK